MIIVDTTVWVDYLRGTNTDQAIWLDRELGRQRIGLTDLILCEVLQGIRRESEFRTVRRDLSKFEVFGTGGADLAIAAAQNYRTLRKRGHIVRKTIDCLIATFCIGTGHALLHSDRDFDPFERVLGLRVIATAAP